MGKFLYATGSVNNTLVNRGLRATNKANKTGILQKNSMAILLLLFLSVGFKFSARAANEVIPAGSFIINMGITPQTVENGLKPYGMIYDIIKNYGVPIKWIVNPNKSKDGIDFSYDGVDYRGGPFIVLAEFRNSEINARISYWETQGVIGSTTSSPIEVPVFTTLTISTVPRWTMDYQNGKLAQPFFENAGIPSDAYGGVAQSGWKRPAELGVCDDVFVMPHADPQWATHSNLLDWNLDHKGSIWLGCHSGSALENMYNPDNPSQQANFLTEKVTSGTNIIQPVFGSTAYAQNSLILWDNHDDGTPPYSYKDPGDPIMQFMGILDGATYNGSEQIYIPVLGSGSGWRPTTVASVYDPDHPQRGSDDENQVAAIIAYGRGFGDDERGYVMMEASHSIAKSSGPENIAAQRAFFNFSFLSGKVKSPAPEVTTNFPSVVSGGVVELSFVISGPRSLDEFTVQWESACGGTLVNTDPYDKTKIIFNAPAVSSPTNCSVTLILTDGCEKVYKSTDVVPITCDVQVETTLTHACDGLTNGSITMSITGGAEPYVWDWTWSGGGTDSGTGTTISGLAAGTYTVTVTPDNGAGCPTTFSVTINTSPAITATATPTHVLCNGASTGSIVVAASGGTPGYTYLWDDGPTTQNRNGLAAGTYNVTVTDSKGCTQTASAEVTETEAIDVTPSVTSVECYGFNTGAISLNVSGGTGPSYQYLWNDGSSDKDRTNLAGGTYSVTVTDENGCTKVESGISVDEPAAITALAAASEILCNGGTSTITVTASGGTGDLQYSLNGGAYQTSNQFAGISASVTPYSITVKDDNDCTTTTSVTVSQPDGMVLSTDITPETCTGDADGAIVLTVSGGTTPYTYAWTASGGGVVPPGQVNDKDLTDLVAGTYTVIVTDAKNCTATTSATVLVSNPDPVTPGNINH